VFVAVAATTAFRAASNPAEGANVVGAILTRWHYLAVLAPLALMVLEWRRARRRVLILLFAAIVLASLEALADVRIRAMRFVSPAPISSLPRDHPFRRRFGMLHGASTLLLVGQIAAAGAVIVLNDPDTPRS
jgi:hypothetical protein